MVSCWAELLTTIAAVCWCNIIHGDVPTVQIVIGNDEISVVRRYLLDLGVFFFIIYFRKCLGK